MYSQIVMASLLLLSLASAYLETPKSPLQKQRSITQTKLLNLEYDIQKQADRLQQFINKVGDVINKNTDDINQKIQEIDTIEQSLTTSGQGQVDESIQVTPG